MNILVTGGAGYIGSHTAKLLSRQGHIPIVLDNLSNGWAEWARFGPFVFGDIRDEETVFRALTAFRVDAVIHFAALASVEESTRRPQEYFANNVGGTIAILKAIQRAAVPRLVFSSSCAVYGKAQTATMAEDHPKCPANPYGLSKWQCEQIIAEVAPVIGLRYAALRYFNVVGNDPEGEIYEKHEPETHVLPNLMKAAQTGGTFTLYGTTHDTPDGTAIRDYVYVLDLAQAHIQALDVLEQRPSLISNVGLGCGVSVQELVATVERVLGLRVKVSKQPIRAGDPPRLVADNGYLQTWFRHDFARLERVVTLMAETPPYRRPSSSQ